MAIIRNATVISVTSNTATVYIDEDGQLPATSVTVYLYTNSSHSGTAAATSITDSAGNATFTGLTPQTTYYVYEEHLTTYPSLTTTPAIVQLQNKNGDNIYPVTLDSGKATITMTNVDPGEGAALQENHFIAVYGDAAKIQTDDIAGGAVTSDKIDFATFEYSTTEQVVGIIGNKLVYRKTFDLTTSTVATSTRFSHGISDFDMLVDVRGSFEVRQGIWEPIVRATNSVNWFNSISDIRGNTSEYPNTFLFEIGQDVDKGRRLIVHLYYTKTS